MGSGWGFSLLLSIALPLYGGDRHRERRCRLRNRQGYIMDSRTACCDRGIDHLSRDVGPSRSTKGLVAARKPSPCKENDICCCCCCPNSCSYVKISTEDRRQGLTPACTTIAINATPITSKPLTDENRASATAAQTHHLRCQALFLAASSLQGESWIPFASQGGGFVAFSKQSTNKHNAGRDGYLKRIGGAREGGLCVSSRWRVSVQGRSAVEVKLEWCEGVGSGATTISLPRLERD